MDILQDARRNIVKGRTNAVECPPKDFNKPYDVANGIVGSSALGAVGLAIGSHAGVALFGTAISGAWILAPILGIAGLAFGAISKGKE